MGLHNGDNIQQNIYERQQQLIRQTAEQLKSAAPSEEVKSSSSFQIFFTRVKNRRSEIIIGILYVIYILIACKNLKNYTTSVYFLSLQPYKTNSFKVVLELVAPIITWIISTKYTYYNYKRQKFIGLYIAIINILVYVAIFFELIWFKLALPIIFKIPVGISITPDMIVSLARLTSLIVSLCVAIVFGKTMFSNISNEHTQKSIMHFKVNRNADNRPNKQFAYDLKIVRKMEDGSVYNISEKDRSLHTMTIGATGTGKTSSCQTVAINGDFDQKIYNEDWQKKQLYRLLQQGKVRLTRDFEDIDFSANYFVPVEGSGNKIKKKLTEIQTLAISAGVTAMAPNAAFADEIFELAKAKGLRARRVDPEMISGAHKEGFIGFNPYYISPRLTGLEREIELFSRSTLVADVLQAIFDQSGNSDPYFASLNQNITTTISSTILLTYPSLHNGTQPTLRLFQSIVNDFQKIKPYRDELVRLYSVNFNPDNSPVMAIGRANVGEYQFLLDTIDNELLGAGAAKMIDQARGLRIIINQILVNPLVKDVLCAENSIDMDEMLADGQITVVNYALKLGSAGVAFGLFFMLSFIKAVTRRPGTEKTRLPHFFYVDEFPTLLHPQEEWIFTYFRQFRTAAMVALQTLDQMDKSKSTAFLRGVLVGNCAHQIIFGRASTSEMEQYQAFAGTQMKMQETRGFSETALSNENPSYTMSTRETMQETDVLSTNDIRMRDFQEVTVFTVKKASAIPPFHGKVDFLPEYKKLRKRRKVYNWHQFYSVGEGEETREENYNILTTSIPVARTSINLDCREDIATDVIQSKTTVLTSRYEKSTTTENPDVKKETFSDIVLTAGDSDNKNPASVPVKEDDDAITF